MQETRGQMVRYVGISERGPSTRRPEKNFLFGQLPAAAKISSFGSHRHSHHTSTCHSIINLLHDIGRSVCIVRRIIGGRKGKLEPADRRLESEGEKSNSKFLFLTCLTIHPEPCLIAASRTRFVFQRLIHPVVSRSGVIGQLPHCHNSYILCSGYLPSPGGISSGVSTPEEI